MKEYKALVLTEDIERFKDEIEKDKRFFEKIIQSGQSLTAQQKGKYMRAMQNEIITEQTVDVKTTYVRFKVNDLSSWMERNLLKRTYTNIHEEH